ncbi:type III deoxyribonuclease [Candidatus Poribacteria bacterium]|nr:type III deoxyribonuclease [Candidatus Poribacteria bacterium]MYH82352.1 type III deoxyribonuclease [Candidatus Poribacteria bacterium]
MMLEQFLHEQLEIAFNFGVPKPEMPSSITQNLSPAFELRPYQEDAFASFIHYFNNDLSGKEKPLHLLFNMATGSGKTLIMAGLILYLYEKGYRNFLFFVNSTNIIEKTKDNFLNPRAAKYLFSENIYFEGKQVAVTQVDSFEGVNENDINLCFTTIQQLHTDMTTQKENALTAENFVDEKIVLLSDEAHHMNVQTRAQLELELEDQKPSWENTVESIFIANEDNLLLEFTATHDYENPNIVDKYRNKIIYRYDLVNFRNDRFSKEVVLVHSDLDQVSRILQALILNQYKEQVAVNNGINLKPVILFKAQRTIAQSQENKANFHKLINELTTDQIDSFRESGLEIVQRAFRFFDEKMTTEALVQRLKEAFREEHCLSVNNDKEKETYQLRLNNLEDKDNPIRAIFAVQKLNEGWDVLNLFDIVRCYEARDSGKNKIGKTTISEAQLIGRGARYFPFVFPDHTDKFRRKFDEDLDHELRVLEELHYHSIHDSRYISEIQTALIDHGMMDARPETRELKLKDAFKETYLYKHGVVWLNRQVPKDYQHVESFADLANLSVKQKNYEHTIYTGAGGVTTLMENGETPLQQRNQSSRDVKVVDIEQNIVKSAIARNPFYTFASLQRYLPHLVSIREFITSENYLGGLAITFKGNLAYLEENRPAKLAACEGLLSQIEFEIRKEITEYEGTKRFYEQQIRAVFTDKTLKFNIDTPRADDSDLAYLVKISDWFAFENLYGTSEEKAFVQMLDRWIQASEESYEDIYLLRNEGHFSLYNFSDGRGFQPDFVLFLREKNGASLSYQLFIEPKGEHLSANDQWKEEFLAEIRTEFQSRILTENSKYRVIGVPSFYHEKYENQFKDDFNAALKPATRTSEQ